MFPIKRTLHETEKQATELFSTLSWRTHPVKTVWIVETKRFRSSADRAFVGKIDESSSSFILTRNRSYFESVLPRVIVKGKMFKNNGKNIVELKFMPGLYISIILFSMIFMAGYMLWNSLISSVGKEVMELVVSFLIILAIAFSLMSWEYN